LANTHLLPSYGSKFPFNNHKTVGMLLFTLEVKWLEQSSGFLFRVLTHAHAFAHQLCICTLFPI
jgi:hypothetical protein